jgi:hypothetical protein
MNYAWNGCLCISCGLGIAILTVTKIEIERKTEKLWDTDRGL